MAAESPEAALDPLESPDPPPIYDPPRIWQAWALKSDREVAREAAMKHSLIEHAVQFLAQRRNMGELEAQQWFKQEVLDWASELLGRQQIHKATYVLKNIKLDPRTEFKNFFYASCSVTFREFIGTYLTKANQLDYHLRLLWNFLDSIRSHADLLFVTEGGSSDYQSLPEDSIRCLNVQTASWKAKVAVKLFFKTLDEDLSRFMNCDQLWKYLCDNNELKLLEIWIDVSNDHKYEPTIDKAIINQLRKFPITNAQLNEVYSEMKIANLVYDTFSKYGRFCNREMNSIPMILMRFRNSKSIPNLRTILYRYRIADRFYKLLINYCLGLKELNVLNCCLEKYDLSNLITTVDDTAVKSNVQLISTFRDLVNTNYDFDSIRRNILSVCQILSPDNLPKYFEENPIILLALLLFTKEFRIDDNIREINYQSLLFDDNIITGTELNDVLMKITVKNPILNTINEMKINDIRTLENTLTIYNLLENHLNISLDLNFPFRFNLSIPIPSFNEITFPKYRKYRKELDYMFFIEENRPSIASKIYILKNQIDSNSNDEQSIAAVKDKVVLLAFKNFNSIEITSSCISFLEITGLGSDYLRIGLSISHLMCNAGHTILPINSINKTSIIDNNINITGFSNDPPDPYQLQNTLENILINSITDPGKPLSLPNGLRLIKAIKIHDIIIKYSRINSIKLPELFLKHCARNNLWLPFLIYAQLYQYPLRQLKLIIPLFKHPNLLEHIYHTHINHIFNDDDDDNVNDENINANAQINDDTDDDDDDNHHVDDDDDSDDMSSTNSVFTDIDIFTVKTTLLETLIRCANGRDPPKALLQASQFYKMPQLAIFATCYEPSSFVLAWLTWLAVSCNLCGPSTNFEAISGNVVRDLLEDCLKGRNLRTIIESFKIFVAGCPLRHFLECLSNLLKCTDDYVNLSEKQLSRADIRLCFFKIDTELSWAYLFDALWLETAMFRLLAITLQYNCDSVQAQLLFIEKLGKIAIRSIFKTFELPNFDNLLRILQNLCNVDSTIRFDFTGYFDNENRRQAIDDCIASLLTEHCFEVALNIAQIEQLPCDLILIEECKYQFETDEFDDDDFWKECNVKFVEFKVKPDLVIEFYLNCLDELNYAEGRYLHYSLLEFATKWAIQYDLANKFDLELRMWLSFLKMRKINQQNGLSNFCQILPTTFLYKDFLDIVDEIPISDKELTNDETHNLEDTIEYLLNNGMCWQALKLQKMFKCKSTDMEMLKLSYSLAEGIILSDQLNVEQRLMLSPDKKSNHLSNYGNSRLRIRLSSVSSFLGPSSPQNGSFLCDGDAINTSPAQCCATNDVLSILQLLSERIEHGKELARNIFLTYRISLNADIPYQLVIVTANCMKILKDALEDDCRNKFQVVYDFVTVYKWSKHDLVDFICEQLINAITNYVETNTDQFRIWDLDVDQKFHLILQLLPENCSPLGYKLYAYANVLHQSQITGIDKRFEEHDFQVVGELLIRAHDCFTADCNMEGISIVLKQTQSVIKDLLLLENWKLIVRLLTGVARYSEMNYVFHLLKENDQFEYLLRKGSRKDGALKVALLDYLKKHCPDNRDLFKIVALHFTLFSEVALLWETEAQNIINNLVSISKLEMLNRNLNPDDETYILFTHTDGTKICLNKIMEDYTHATEFHLQGEKLSKAMNSARQAELIALQLSLLKRLPANGTAVCLLNLKNSQIASLVSTILSFEQTLIVIEAYNYHTDWAGVLYEQYLLQNNAVYMEMFLQHFPLTDSLVYDISRKFINSKGNAAIEVKNMKELLIKLPSVHMKYRIASELGFLDLVEDLIEGEQLVYLKDTVWKKGYKNN